MELYLLRRCGKRKKSVSDLHSVREADNPVDKKSILGSLCSSSSTTWLKQVTEAPHASVS